MRSAFYWFAEFCQSQCLSHFAASFIDTRAEGSIAESCKEEISYNHKRFQVDWYRLSSDDRPSRETGARPPSRQATSTGQCHALTVRFRVEVGLSCKWSFRRFTYGNLVTTSASSSSKGLRKFPSNVSGTESLLGPDNSPVEPIGSSDGRCVQRAGT